MKILQAFRYHRDPDGFSMRTFPDSALLKGGKPVFLPCEEHEYRLSAGMALVIGKLGKGFAPRFADRYVEHVAPVAVFEDITMAMALAGESTCASMAWSFDGAVNIGCMLPPRMLTETITFRLGPLCHNGMEVMEYRFAAEAVMPQWREALSFMARTMTFRTGDMVVLARESPLKVAPESCLTACFAPAPIYETNNPKHHDTILDFNIK